MDPSSCGRAALLCAAALVWSCGDGPFASGPVVEGEWGGDGALLRAGEDAARVEFGCSAGVVRGTIPLGDDGAFSRRGVVSFNGPLGPDRLPATFSGRVADGRMTLTIELTAGGPEIVFPPFTLERGRPGSLPLCAAA
jgi:hypothetical protein